MTKGCPLFTTAFVVLLILKICGAVNISWLVVFLPIFVSVGIVIFYLSILAAVHFLYSAINRSKW